MRTADVIVVGAGPVGTVAAYALARRGADVVLCEAGDSCAQDLRASTFHPPTIEMLDDLGVAGDIIEYGLKAPVFHFRERETGETVAFDMSELADVTRFPYRIQCEQHVMAGMLADALESHPDAEVRYRHRVIAFEQDDDGVTAAFETPYEIEKIRARYLIACDGGNSIIRKWLGAEFDGFTYPEKFLCVSTKLDLRDYIDGLCWVNYVADPNEWLVLLRAPSVWRVLVPADENTDDKELLSDATRDGIFSRLIGNPDVATEHRTIYRVHQRVVNQFNHGRVFLAGDAAHLNNPIGGFGMNSGIHDVWNLKDRILSCLESGHDEPSFEQYDRQRRSVTNSFIQHQTMQNKELLEHGAEEGHARRFARMKAASEDPDARRAYILRQSMIESLREAASIG
ncbi:MAG: NAD(P)/FAD-dependent oxidoreductase [Pseudomonadota bacterium]